LEIERHFQQSWRLKTGVDGETRECSDISGNPIGVQPLNELTASFVQHQLALSSIDETSIGWQNAWAIAPNTLY
jgi:hypothetical protein